MKIILAGTGSVFSHRLSPCFLIDRRIVLELPNGAVKALKPYTSVEDTELCILSHFHGDHCLDLPFLLLEKKRCGKKITLITPRGGTEQIRRICYAAYDTLDWDTIFREAVESVVELTGQSYRHGSYMIVSVPVTHGEAACAGYLILSDGCAFGYTGDCSICEGAEAIIRRADVCCADMNSFKSTSGHMSAEDLVPWAARYPNRIYAVHTEDSELIGTSAQGIRFPADGEEIILGAASSMP